MKKMLFILTVGLSINLSANVNLNTEIAENGSKKYVETVKLDRVLKKKKLCGVNITYFDKYGNVIGWEFRSSQQEDYVSCAQFQAGVINELRSQGYIVTSS